MKDKSVKELIQSLAGDPAAEYYAKPCEVLTVDESARTCDVRPYDGSADIYGVRLQAVEGSDKGVVQIPKSSSAVLVVFISKSRAFVSLCEEVDKVLIDCEEVVYNGGENGGWLIAPDVLDQVNKMKDRMTQLELALTTFASSQASAAASAPLTPLAAAPAALGVSLAALPPSGLFNDLLIDDKITH
jgi:hypothetical protein